MSVKTDPDYRRLISDLILKDLDNYLALINSRGKTGVFSVLTKIVSRQDWGAAPPKKENKNNEIPLDHFVISWTNTDPCMTDEKCAKAVRDIQKEHMEQGEDDIKHNFLIGGNGVIYEGRGWETGPSFDKENRNAANFQTNSINVAFINHPGNKPPHIMLKAISTLYSIGREKNYLKKTAHFSRLRVLAKYESRAEWGALAPIERREQELPVPNLVISWTGQDICMTKEACTAAVQNLQREHMEQGEVDIRYNFLVGGDGLVYEGRGWNTVCSYDKLTPGAKDLEGVSIQIGLINRPTKRPPYNTLKGVATILATATANQYMTDNVQYAKIVNNEIRQFCF